MPPEVVRTRASSTVFEKASSFVNLDLTGIMKEVPGCGVGEGGVSERAQVDKVRPRWALFQKRLLESVVMAALLIDGLDVTDSLRASDGGAQGQIGMLRLNKTMKGCRMFLESVSRKDPIIIYQLRLTVRQSNRAGALNL